MIVAHGANTNGEDSLLLILEPGNIAKLQIGQPLIRRVKEFLPDFPRELEIIIAFCPDTEFVSQQVRQGINFLEALKMAADRPDAFPVRHDDEKLVRHEFKER